LQGATGLEGDTGSQGQTGSQGETGAQGNAGGYTGVANVILDGGGSTISTGTKGHVEMPFDFKLYSWALRSLETGSILLELRKSSYAGYPPGGSGVMHIGATGPFIGNDWKNQETGLSGWASPTGAAGDSIQVAVSSVSAITQVSLALRYNKI